MTTTRDPAPLVVACLTHADPRPDVDPLSGRFRVHRASAGPAPAELAALELALRIGEAWKATVLAVSAGGTDAEITLRDAAAVGARPLRVAWESDEVESVAGDAGPLARALAEGIAAVGRPALVLCGDRSPLRGAGAVPGLLAHHLGMGLAVGVVRVALEGTQLVGERRLERGARERFRVAGPAVLTVEGAGIRLRRASLTAGLVAQRAPVPVATPSPRRPPVVQVGRVRPYRPRPSVVPAPPGPDPRNRLLALTAALSTSEPAMVVGPLDPAPAADAVLEYLARRGYLGPGAGGPPGQ